MGNRGPILLVEDDEATAELEKRALVRHGHTVHCVREVSTALDLLAREAFSLVLLDYHLVDGLSWPVLDAAQAGEHAVPVILVTSLGDEKVAAEAIQRGATAYVIKMGEYCEHLAKLADRITRLLEVEREHARLAAIVAASDDAIVSETVTGVIVTWNMGAVRMFGYSAEEMIGQPFSRLVPDDCLQVAAQNFDRLLRGEIIRNFETVRVRKDGGRVHVSTSLSPLRHEGSADIVGVSLIARDITAQVVAEESRRRSENRFRRLVESNVVGVHIGSDTGFVVEANDNFLDMVGYSRADLPFRWTDLHPPQERSTASAMRDEVKRTGRIPVREVEFISKTGHRVPLLFALASLEDQEALIVTLDLTESKRLERQLLQAQKMEGIGRLAGGVAHDFNNVLTVINGYCQMMRDALSPLDPMRADLVEVCDAGDRAARLTGQLLAFSRQQVLDPQPLDVNMVVENLGKMLRRLIGEDIEFVTRLAPGLRLTRIDAGQMEQVLMNLVVNARDAMPAGGHLTVETRGVELDEDSGKALGGLSAGGYVLVAVTDTGSGMDEATQSHVFEPFFTTKRPGHGTGLGLSTVYGIVRQSQGHVCVYSVPDKGTTFMVYLPVCSPAPLSSPPISTPSGRPRGTETILLVEDEPSIGKMVQLLLKQRGYSVLHCVDGMQALSLAEQHAEPIHLLLTDLVMPKMGGLDLAQKLGTSHPETRVVYMSGYSDKAVGSQECLAPGMNFVAKPFAPDVLLRKIREVLGLP